MPLLSLRGWSASRQDHDPDDFLVVETQAQRNVALVRHFACFAPAGDLTSPGKDVAVNILELRLRLFHRESLVSARLLKHLPARRDATKGPARGNGLDTGVEELFRRLEIMRRNSFDELTCASGLHRIPARLDSMTNRLTLSLETSPLVFCFEN